MNVMTTSALLCAAGLLVGVAVARIASTPKEKTPMTDLLQHKIDALTDQVIAGELSDQTRRAIVASLMRHLDTITTMENVLRTAPPVSLANAELVVAAGAPILNVYFRPGHMHAWRMYLYAEGFAEVGITDQGMEFAGPFVLRLAYLPHRLDMGMRAGVAA